MVHCPDCGSSLDAIDDVTFEDVDSSIGFVRAAKRFYNVSCAECGVTLGSGVAGARGNGGAADAGGA
ncbi:hypothetical protein SAMN04487947_0303 [Halogeometricum rufum]|jgi:ribosomal protein S27E|uniref:Uncharacterized protein n=1 Tax=Halogeometricum rufum TaxID=553469 RepID=A0A1I6FZM0_9EURY|nr:MULTISPECIES: hypothetical protein [Halogeometricum]MUV59031.1 hypothetical protein [Halogeometricum sp. CBA1124]SFR35340.1 hypothetical protein SAMN04487947_0303 [Halogeometricum rufum]